jgi:SAM-dependent methyltransferase
MTSIKLSIPKLFRRGSLRDDERASIDSALRLLTAVNEIKPIKGASILDFGCGVKLVQALLESHYDFSKYVGVDVYRSMIEHLQSALKDDRFEFAALNFHNEMYNKKGDPMTGESRLPIRDSNFNILTMFSVITHMIPDDVVATLKIMRSYAAPDSKLIFSTFIDFQQEIDFVDTDPKKPLLRAVYRKEFLDELVQSSGWTIESFRKPIPQVIQHHYVCTPH